MTSHESDEVDCSHALMQVYEYLDGEMGPEDCVKIRQHLAECGQCLNEYDIDQMLKTVVRRSCGCESAPTELRMQIMARITTITLEIQG